MTPQEATNTLKSVQSLIGTVADGKFGPKSFAALNKLIITADGGAVVHSGLASSFADPADVAAYKRCRANGGSFNECLAVGDNGEGTPALGDVGEDGNRHPTDTTGSTPMCALPPGDWKPLGDKAPGALVLVTHDGIKVVCELRDTLPAKPKHGVVIDLNPAAAKALGLKPPFMVPATWQFIDSPL